MTAEYLRFLPAVGMTLGSPAHLLTGEAGVTVMTAPTHRRRRHPHPPPCRVVGAGFKPAFPCLSHTQTFPKPLGSLSRCPPSSPSHPSNESQFRPLDTPAIMELMFPATQTAPPTTGADDAPSLADIVHEQTQGGRLIVDFLAQAALGGLPDFKPCHRLQASDRLIKLESSPEFTGMVREHTRGGDLISQFLISAVMGRLPGFQPCHRMEAIRQLAIINPKMARALTEDNTPRRSGGVHTAAGRRRGRSPTHRRRGRPPTHRRRGRLPRGHRPTGDQRRQGHRPVLRRRHAGRPHRLQVPREDGRRQRAPEPMVRPLSLPARADSLPRTTTRTPTRPTRCPRPRGRTSGTTSSTPKTARTTSQATTRTTTDVTYTATRPSCTYSETTRPRAPPTRPSWTTRSTR